jgi:hypothetical protein
MAVELSVWVVLLGWGQPMSMRVWQWKIISLAMMKRAASSDSVADAMTKLTIWTIQRMVPLNRGNGSSSKRKMCAQALLRDLVLLRKIMLLD